MSMRYFILFLALTYKGMAQYNSVQMMHNSADTSVKHLKLWINDTVWMQQFDYLMATPQVFLSLGIHTIGVSAPGATSQAQSIAQATLDNTSANYKFAFLAVVGIHSPGPQYNPGSSVKPFGIYTFTYNSLAGEPSPWQCFLYVSHLSTDIPSLTVVSGTTNFANALDYRNTTSMFLTVTQFPYGTGTYTVSVSSPSGSIGTGTLNLQGGKNICLVSTGFIDTLANARVEGGGGKRFVLAVLPPQGGIATEIPIRLPDVTTGAAELIPAAAPRLYPSPVSDRLFVELEGRKPIAVTIYDLFGKIVLSENIESSAEYIDLPQLPAGFYLVSVFDGINQFNSKIIVK